GACGYGEELHKASYGKYSAELSSILFSRESACGACYDQIFMSSLTYGLSEDSKRAFDIVKCQRSSGLKFTMSGSSHFYHVLITNVGNLGWMVKVVVVKMKGSRTGWIPIARNWGKIGISMSTFNISLCPLRSLSAVVHTSSEVSPEKWQFGQTFDGKQF
ncbi:hypothetical protein Lal_00034139, partial [Lupinus albus]